MDTMNSIIDLFEQTFQNLKVTNASQIKGRRDEITKALNKHFRNSDSATSHRLMVGSWGRHTSINGVSDLDMVYILPATYENDFRKEGGARKALEHVKAAILERYARTQVSIDHLVVVVQFSDYKFEVQPCFEREDGSFDFPDTYADTWKKTNPRAEIEAMSVLDETTSGNARKLSRLVRAWKRKHDVAMNGLLIDTLVWKFFWRTSDYRSSILLFDQVVLDFFSFLSKLPNQENWHALGSGQVVKAKKRFQWKAKKAAELCAEAIEAEGQQSMYAKWRKVFGRFVPASADSKTLEAKESYRDTEEFIEDFYAVDIQYDLTIGCTVYQNGFRPKQLWQMLQEKIWLRPNKSLHFTVEFSDVPEPYNLRWKVLNRGEEAWKRDEIRGQIIADTGKRDHREHTRFRGEHYVECYAIKRGVVVARAHIDVPIEI